MSLLLQSAVTRGSVRPALSPTDVHDVLECWKSQPAPKPPRKWLRLQVEGDRVYIDAAEPPKAPGPAAAPVREQLRPQMHAALDAKTPLRRAEVARAVGRDAKDGSVGRVLDELVAAGDAGKTGDGWVVIAEAMVVPGSACHPATPPDFRHGYAHNEGGNRRAALTSLPPQESIG